MATGTRPKISIGLDVGGTKIAAGVVSDGTVLERLEQPTPVGGSSAVETMFEMIGSLRQRHRSNRPRRQSSLIDLILKMSIAP